MRPIKHLSVHVIITLSLLRSAWAWSPPVVFDFPFALSPGNVVYGSSSEVNGRSFEWESPRIIENGIFSYSLEGEGRFAGVFMFRIENAESLIISPNSFNGEDGFLALYRYDFDIENLIYASRVNIHSDSILNLKHGDYALISVGRTGLCFTTASFELNITLK